MSFFHYRRPAQLGFSLVELMVTISIVTVITAIVMFRYSAFDSSILLNNQAYEIALDIRETQVRAISIQASEASSDPFASNFGLHFDSTQPGQYILFQDSSTIPNNNGIYDSGEEIGAALTIDSRFQIDRIYLNNSDTPGNTVTNASIVFRRPNFDANLKGTGFSSASSIHVVIESIRNQTAQKTVVIYSSGQISVE